MRRGLLGLSVLLVLAGCSEPEAPPSESARMLDQVVAQVKAAKTMHAKFRISATSRTDRALHSLSGDVDLVLRPGAAPDLTAHFVEQDMHHADDVTDNDLVVAGGRAYLRSAAQGRPGSGRWTEPDPDRPDEKAARALGAITLTDPLAVLDTGIREVAGEVEQAPVYRVLRYEWEAPAPGFARRWTEATLGDATSVDVRVLVKPDGQLHSLKVSLYGTTLGYNTGEIEYSGFGEPVTVTAP